MEKKAVGSIPPLPSTALRPRSSYAFRDLGSPSVWYAAPIFWNSAAASGLSGFLSGWHLSAFL